MADNAMNTEWEAWRAVCKALRERGVKINDDAKMAHLLIEWGERLVALRGGRQRA